MQLPLFNRQGLRSPSPELRDAIRRSRKFRMTRRQRIDWINCVVRNNLQPIVNPKELGIGTAHFMGHDPITAVSVRVITASGTPVNQ